jgi:hypothetical protein
LFDSWKSSLSRSTRRGEWAMTSSSGVTITRVPRSPDHHVALDRLAVGQAAELGDVGRRRAEQSRERVVEGRRAAAAGDVADRVDAGLHRVPRISWIGAADLDAPLASRCDQSAPARLSTPSATTMMK